MALRLWDIEKPAHNTSDFRNLGILVNQEISYQIKRKSSWYWVSILNGLYTLSYGTNVSFL